MAHASADGRDVRHKTFAAPMVKALDEQAGILEAIVSVYGNVDRDKEKILSGCFAKSIGRKLPKGVWMHDWKIPVAKTLEAEELRPGDPRLPESIAQNGGLYIKGAFNLETQRGREAFSDLKFGTVDEFSIGFSVEKSRVDTKTGVREFVEAEIYEWSPVLVGANPATALLSAKGAFLGDTDEPMAAAALDQLMWRLSGFLYGIVCDETSSLDDRLAMVDGGCVEFAETVKKLISALLGESPEEEAAEYATLAAGLADAMLKRLGSIPNPMTGGVVAASSFASRSQELVAGLAEFKSLARKFADTRAKAGRVLSEANRTRIRSVCDAMRGVLSDMDALLAETEPQPSQDGELVSLQARAIQRRAKVRALALGSTT